MNKILFLILLIFTFGCSDSEKKPKKSEQEKLEIKRKRFYVESKEYIEENGDKIYLLATTKNIPYKSLKSLFIEYYGELKLIDKTKIENRDKLFLKLSKDYKLSTIEIAKLIYSFQYEMITIDEAIDNEMEKNYDPADYEPDYH
ncbi:hypothetical protein ABF176_002571 [Flavobacterium psychrophilum]